jgi:hypothetical protein
MKIQKMVGLYCVALLIVLNSVFSNEQERYKNCLDKFGSVAYIPESRMFDQYPAHLMSFPGSGNAWLRKLIEFSTGIYTGSMDSTDNELLSIFPGEKACGLRMSVLRTHPHFLDVQKGKLKFRYLPQDQKCKRGLIREFKRMIFLVRNPHDALWSYYQLLNTLSHGDYIREDTFDADNWNYYAPILAAQWDKEFYEIVMPAFETNYQPEDVTIVRYEDLLDPARRENVLVSLLEFMHYTVSPERVSCAFLLSDTPALHRSQHDSRRVLAKSVFLPPSLLPHSNSNSNGKGATGSSSSSSSNADNNGAVLSALDLKDNEIYFPVNQATHANNLLCELHEHLKGIAMHFNYSVAPTSLDLSAFPHLCDQSMHSTT